MTPCKTSMCRLLAILSLTAVCRAGTLYEELTALNASRFKSLVDQSGLGSMFNGTNGRTLHIYSSVCMFYAIK